MACSSSDIESQPLLSAEWTRPVELMLCHTVRLPARYTNHARALTLDSPSLSHLKRVRHWPPPSSPSPPPSSVSASKEWTQVLLCPVDGHFDETCYRDLISVAARQPDLELHFEEVAVSRHQPWTHEQWAAWGQHWPLGPCLNRVPPSLPTSPSALEALRALMGLAVASARASAAAGSPHPNGAVVYDPATQRVVATASDLVAVPRHPLMHAVMAAAAEVGRQATEGEREGRLPHHLMTGWHLFVVREPCVMCSMALVHCRIARVFYAVPHVRNGGLGSCYSLHLNPALNHHFDVFRGSLGCPIDPTFKC